MSGSSNGNKSIELIAVGEKFKDYLIFDAGKDTVFKEIDGGISIFEAAFKKFSEGCNVKVETVSRGSGRDRASEQEPALGRRISFAMPIKVEGKNEWRIHVKDISPPLRGFSSGALDEEAGKVLCTFKKFRNGGRITLSFVHCAHCAERQFEESIAGSRMPGVGSTFNAVFIVEDLAEDLQSRAEDGNGSGVKEGDCTYKGNIRTMLNALCKARTYRMWWPLGEGEKCKIGKSEKFKALLDKIEKYDTSFNRIFTEKYYKLKASSKAKNNFNKVYYYCDLGYDELEDRFPKPDRKSEIYIRMGRGGVRSRLFRCVVLGHDDLRDRLTLLLKVRTLRQLGVEISRYSYDRAIRDLMNALAKGFSLLRRRMDNGDTKAMPRTGAEELAIMAILAKRLVIRFDLEAVLLLEISQERGNGGQPDQGDDAGENNAGFYPNAYIWGIENNENTQVCFHRIEGDCGRDGHENVVFHGMVVNIKLTSSRSGDALTERLYLP